MNALETAVSGKSKAQLDGATTRWVSFELAGQQYAVSILKVFEVLSHADIEPVPQAPRAVVGVINLRGSIVTVLDLRAWLGFAASTVNPCIIIINHENQAIGICVDRIIEVLNISNDAIKPAPGSAAQHVAGLVSQNGELLTLLELSDLFAGESAPQVH